ncbi:protein of unknown function [Legionella hackeliae]|uniref:Uncharacterized protein n=1 Tax=Legionella hackeliae TaxID=449 RepID=A0A0A8USL2_LEGHA|nr:protein of unknown function [Legionella hackeliae]
MVFYSASVFILYTYDYFSVTHDNILFKFNELNKKTSDKCSTKMEMSHLSLRNLLGRCKK